MKVEWKYYSANCASGDATISTKPCLVKGAVVVTSPSADFVVADNTTDVLKVPASAAVGNAYDLDQARFETSLKVECSGTGLITVLYRELDELNL